MGDTISRAPTARKGSGGLGAPSRSSSPQGDSATKDANPIDVHVGARIRARRRQLGWSQTALAEELGLTFQQVQKYESGANRVSASKLWAIADTLQCDVGLFFEGLTRSGEIVPGEPCAILALTASADGAELAQRYRDAGKPQRHALIACARALTTVDVYDPRTDATFPAEAR